MRARNREINIFNMSLLDILTGMLGAFLFLMLGMLPYYARVSKSKDSIPAAEAKALHDKIDAQARQIADLQKEIEDLQNKLAQQTGDPEAFKKMQQQLDDMTKDRDFWKAQQGVVSIISYWGYSNTDIDVLVMDPDGNIFSPKNNDKVLGKKSVFDGDDSHTNAANPVSHEGLLLYLTKPGDYLVFYRVPPNGRPGDYDTLSGYYMYNESLGKGNGVTIMENTLGVSNARWAQPGGLYAWAVISFDQEKGIVSTKDASTVKLPRGITLPRQQTTPSPPAH